MASTLRRSLTSIAACAPRTLKTPHTHGDAIIITDVHSPFFDVDAICKVCEAGELLSVKKLIIGGDLIHGDTISKYLGVGKTVPIADEMIATSKLLKELEAVFTNIIIIPGNHDQRVEKLIARLSLTADGRNTLAIVARALGIDDDPEHITRTIFEYFFSSSHVTIHPLPQLLLNNTWLIQHPATATRTSPQGERRMATKHRKCIIQGHNHLFAVGFDDSGQDIVANIGHVASDEKWRYMRERPSNFPATVRGFCAIICDKTAPRGRLLPLALHNRWFDLSHLRDRLCSKR